jgi:hypothetical protein
VEVSVIFCSCRYSKVRKINCLTSKIVNQQYFLTFFRASKIGEELRWEDDDKLVDFETPPRCSPIFFFQPNQKEPTRGKLLLQLGYYVIRIESFLVWFWGAKYTPGI